MVCAMQQCNIWNLTDMCRAKRFDTSQFRKSHLWPNTSSLNMMIFSVTINGVQNSESADKRKMKWYDKMLVTRVTFSETGNIFVLNIYIKTSSKIFSQLKDKLCGHLGVSEAIHQTTSHCKKQTFWPMQMESSQLCYQKYLQCKIFNWPFNEQHCSFKHVANFLTLFWF